MEIRDLARQGLAHSQEGRLLAPLRARSAAKDLDAVAEAATLQGDRATLGVVAIARRVEGGSAVRLAGMRAAFRAMEKGALSSVGFQTALASDMVDEMDRAKPSQELRAKNVRGMLSQIAENSAATGEREAPYAAFIVDIADDIPNPRLALNMLTRVDVPEVGDVVRPAWYAVVATGASYDQDFNRDLAGAVRVLDTGEKALRELAKAQGRTEVEDHFARLARYQSLAASPATKHHLRESAMRIIADELPCVPETAIVLAYKTARESAVPREEARLLSKAAVAEALADLGQAGPETPYRSWLRFHQGLEAVDIPVEHRARLQSSAIYSIVEGRAATLDFLRLDIEQLTQAIPPDLKVLDLLSALDVAQDAGWRAEAAAGLKLADGCAKGWSEALLGRTLDRVRGGIGDDARARVLLEAADPAQPRQTLENLLRSGQDKVQDAIVDALIGRPEAGTVTVDPEYVMIGSVRVPRRSLHRN